MVTAALFYVEVFVILIGLIIAFTICFGRMGGISFRRNK